MTFLFTDVEGSTRSWLRNPREMSVALARHDAVIESLVASHGGQVVRPRGEGDSRFAVFSRPSDAISAACAIQIALLKEDWPLPDPLSVRMAVHTGESELRMGDYYGPAVNHCARLRSAAHGGQILVSTITADLVREALTADVDLQDLGEYQLKDLERRERIWQLVHPELPAEFPPLPLGNPSDSNLQYQLSSFIGRKNAIAELRRLLPNARLLTLVGPGGIGKTRLALAVAEVLRPEYAGGVRVAELASVADPELVASSVGAVFGVRESGDRLFEQLVAMISSRPVLLVLDNCEHVVSACAELTERLLRSCSDLRILATSREPLGVPGEITWGVPALAVPEEHYATTPKASAESEAVQLFVERARAVDSGFELTEHNVAAVADVCRRLDGIPLAIELAAARIKVLSPQQIGARLKDRFQLLVGGNRTAPRRQQTLRATLEWSYDLLSSHERLLFDRLSVFSGGWMLEAAETVCTGGGLDPDEILDLLARLVDKSLVVSTRGIRRTSVRYRCLETLREYGRERLLERGEFEAVAERHAQFCLKMGELAELSFVPNQLEAIGQLLRERDNLRSALAWFIDKGDVTCAQRLGGAIYRLWQFHGPQSEGRAWLVKLLALDEKPDVIRIKLLHGAGLLACHLTDFASGETYGQESLLLARSIGDDPSIAYSLQLLGLVAMGRRQHAVARELFEQGVRTIQAADPRGPRLGHVYPKSYSIYIEILNLQFLGQVEGILGNHSAAEVHVQAALARATEVGLTRSMASGLRFLGLANYRKGDYAAARGYVEKMLSYWRAVGERWEEVWSLMVLGCIARDEGDLSGAYSLLRQSLTAAQTRDAAGLRNIAEALDGFVGLACACGQYERAARLSGAAAGLYERTDFHPMAALPVSREHWVKIAAAELGVEKLEAEQVAGRALTIAEVIDEALAVEPLALR